MTMTYQDDWPNASTEPLDIIEVNECHQQPTLTVERFRRCFNEIARLTNERDDAMAEIERRRAYIDTQTAENERLRAELKWIADRRGADDIDSLDDICERAERALANEQSLGD